LVKRALRAVERRQAKVRTRDALLNVYAEHLSGIQKILSKAADDMSSAATQLAKPSLGSPPPDGGALGKGPGRPTVR
jgi:hypothetical protein